MSKPFKVLLDKMTPESRQRIKEKAEIIRREIDRLDSLNSGKAETSDAIKTDKTKK